MRQPPSDPTAKCSWTTEQLHLQVRNGPLVRGEQPPPFDSWFEVKVFLLIAGQGYQAIPQFEVDGYHIDIVIVIGTRKIAVECDGDKWHGPDRYKADMQRQKRIERYEWEFFRIRECHFNRHQGKALLPLWEMIESDDHIDEQDKVVTEHGRGSDDMREHVAVEDGGNPHESNQLDGGDGDKVGTNANDGTNDASSAETARNTEPSRTLNVEPDVSRNDSPSSQSVAAVLSLPSRDLGRVICEILEQCPNFSSKKADLTSRVWKHFSVITRGAPWKQLEKKVGWALTQLKKTGKVEEYKAKNVRIRLRNPSKQRKLL